LKTHHTRTGKAQPSRDLAHKVERTRDNKHDALESLKKFLDSCVKIKIKAQECCSGIYVGRGQETKDVAA
jgi:hypothetical protein